MGFFNGFQLCILLLTLAYPCVEGLIRLFKGFKGTVPPKIDFIPLGLETDLERALLEKNVMSVEVCPREKKVIAYCRNHLTFAVPYSTDAILKQCASQGILIQVTAKRVQHTAIFKKLLKSLSLNTRYFGVLLLIVNAQQFLNLLKMASADFSQVKRGLEVTTEKGRPNSLKAFLDFQSAGFAKLAERPKTSFKDVVGYKNEKEALQVFINYLKNQDQLKVRGLKVPKGVLLSGPPGTGKTQLVRALAGESNLPIFAFSGSDFEGRYIGTGAAKIRALFKEASKMGPCIIFIDEIETLGASRNTAFSSESNSTLNEFLVELDGFSTDSQILVIGATNYPDRLDSALTRPGRLTRHIALDLPCFKDRQSLFEFYLAKVRASTGISSEKLASLSRQFSGAEIANIVNEACLMAFERCELVVTQALLEEAITRLRVPSVQSQHGGLSEETYEAWSYQVAAEAFVATLLYPIHHAVSQIELSFKGNQALLVEYLYDAASDAKASKPELFSKLVIAQAGLQALQLWFGPEKVNLSSVNRAQFCNKVAVAMFTQYAMTSVEEPQLFLGSLMPDTKPCERYLAKRDAYVLKAIELAISCTRSILKEHQDLIKALAVYIQLHQGITGENLRAFISNQLVGSGIDDMNAQLALLSANSSN